MNTFITNTDSSAHPYVEDLLRRAREMSSLKRSKRKTQQCQDTLETARGSFSMASHWDCGLPDTCGCSCHKKDRQGTEEFQREKAFWLDIAAQCEEFLA